MGKKRSPIFTVETPFPKAPKVILFDSTLIEHILPYHPEMNGQIQLIKNTLENPTFICPGSANDYFQYVGTNYCTNDGQPTVVVVSTVDARDGCVVATAFGGRKTKYSSPDNFAIISWPST